MEINMRKGQPKPRPAKRKKNWTPPVEPIKNLEIENEPDGRWWRDGSPDQATRERFNYVKYAIGDALPDGTRVWVDSDGHTRIDMERPAGGFNLEPIASPKAPYCARMKVCNAGSCQYPRPCDSQTIQPDRADG